MKKILVTEDLVQEGIDLLREHGCTVDFLIDPTADELAGAIAPYDGLIVHPNTVVDVPDEVHAEGRGPLGHEPSHAP